MKLSHWAFNTRLDLQYWGRGHKTQMNYLVQKSQFELLLASGRSYPQMIIQRGKYCLITCWRRVANGIIKYGL